VNRPPRLARTRLFAKNLTPPYLWHALKWTKDRVLAARREPEPPPPAEAAVEREPEPPPPPPATAPEWEYVPEGWAREAKGWNVDAVADAYAVKWPSYVAAVSGPWPLGINHEVPAGEPVDRLDREAHNTVVSYGYALALAAHGKSRLSILDWGGALGHYEPLSRALLPGVELDFHCKEVPALVERGRELLPHVTFHAGPECLERRYDFVLASGSLQYAEDWPGLLSDLAGAAEHLFVTRLPVALAAPSFVVLQRAYRYGYETEYLGWVVSRDELLEAARAANLSLVREFLLSAWFSAEGAPENPVEHRAYLFRSVPSGHQGRNGVQAEGRTPGRPD
jgi:putative methyltransferase (TIGR04325 family)